MPTVDWQPDPTGRHDTRRRNPDGTWSDQVADYGVMSRDTYDGTQPEPISVEPEETETPSLKHDQPTEPKPKSNRGLLWVIIVILLLFAGYACGPEAICLAQGGSPSSNAFGVEICDVDKDGKLDDDDWRLQW